MKKEPESWIYTGDDPQYRGVTFEAVEDSKPVGDGFYTSKRSFCSKFSMPGMCLLCFNSSCFVKRVINSSEGTRKNEHDV